MGDRIRRVVEWRNHPYAGGVRVFITPDSALLLWEARRQYVYKGAYLPFVSQSSADQRRELSSFVWGEQEMKRKSAKTGPGSKLHASPDLLKGHYPNLAEFLTCGVYDDGARREAPTLTLWASGGQWKCILKDRAEELVMWLSAERLLELIQLAESMCLEEDGPWRVDDSGPQHGKRKRGLA